jgi:ribosome biogenesis SPOUT family RNA methylase Rps3
VSKPGDKLFYLNSILQTHRVIYYDDLSYNHENGKVLFYEKMIEEIKKMDIVYYDYDFIKKLNS